MKVINSPNFNSRPVESVIDTIVIHHTATKDTETALKILTSHHSQVSSHYLISKNGDLIQLVSDEKRAWHAGVSSWQNKNNINHNSIGIEIVNDGYEPFPLKQIHTVIDLIHKISFEYKISHLNVVAHGDIAPGRKVDPHALFPWHILAAKGIGIYVYDKEYHNIDMNFLDNQTKSIPNLQIVSHSSCNHNDNYKDYNRKNLIDMKDIEIKLKKIGYKIDPSSNTYTLMNGIKAFYRRHKGEELKVWTIIDQLHLDKVCELYDKHGLLKIKQL